MILLYFEDWTPFLFMLDRKRIEHGDRLIKVFTSPVDPRVLLDKPGLKIVDQDDSPLNGMEFRYKKRPGKFTGDEIEKRIADFNPLAKSSIRGLFRFSNRKDLLFCQTGMGMKRDGKWLIDHPLKEIDFSLANSVASQANPALIHLDIFNAKSLARLSRIVDFSKETQELVDLRDGNKLKREIFAEFSGRGTERR